VDGSDPPSSGTTAAWESYATRIIGGLSLLVLLGTVVYRVLEDWSWVDSFYFSSVTLTTVGFGDLSPTTTVSKLFTVFYIFTGISLIGAIDFPRVDPALMPPDHPLGGATETSGLVRISNGESTPCRGKRRRSQ